MPGSKECTLGKSSEISTYLLIQEMKNVKQDNKELLKDLYKDIIVSIIGAFFSAVVTFIVENPASVLKTVDSTKTNAVNSSVNFDMFYKLIDKIIHSLILFVICFSILMFIYWVIKKAIKAFAYNKSSQENRERLVELFNKKVFNQIMLGISFYNKTKSLKEYDLNKIYLWEAIYYFDVSRKDIDDESIIEEYNDKNEDYKALIKDLNPYLLYETFNTTCSILNEITKKIDQIPEYNSNDELKDKVTSLYEQYNCWLNNINPFIQKI